MTQDGDESWACHMQHAVRGIESCVVLRYDTDICHVLCIEYLWSGRGTPYSIHGVGYCISTEYIRSISSLIQIHTHTIDCVQQTIGVQNAPRCAR